MRIRICAFIFRSDGRDEVLGLLTRLIVIAGADPQSHHFFMEGYGLKHGFLYGIFL
jgi:hypothetical protein